MEVDVGSKPIDYAGFTEHKVLFKVTIKSHLKVKKGKNTFFINWKTVYKCMKMSAFFSGVSQPTFSP